MLACCIPYESVEPWQEPWPRCNSVPLIWSKRFRSILGSGRGAFLIYISSGGSSGGRKHSEGKSARKGPRSLGWCSGVRLVSANQPIRPAVVRSGVDLQCSAIACSGG